jgi:DNA (cytosine-5)-methyltransferase 1
LTNFTFIELFAGAGGMALGLKNSGLRGVGFIEYDNDAFATLVNNFAPRTRGFVEMVHPEYRYISEGQCFIRNDIRKVVFSNSSSVDIVSGGFPCQPFSYAGKKLGLEDTRGTMFYEFARALKELSPKLFIAENVKGILTHNKGETLKTILNSFEEIGYNVEYKVLNANDFDVGQIRKRLFFIGARKDLNIKIEFPEKQPFRPALKHVIGAGCMEQKGSLGYLYSERKREIMDLIPPGGNWKDLDEVHQKLYMGKLFSSNGDSTGVAKRLSWTQPSPTLTCSPSQKLTERCHPGVTRPLTVAEYARIQSFPPEYKFCGSIHSQYRQIGNAVPVNLAFHLGKSLIKMLQSKENKSWFKRVVQLIGRV